MTRRNCDRPVSLSLEQAADRWVHALSLTFAVVACLALGASVRWDDSPTVVGLAIYAFGLVATFVCSALYNMTERTAPHSFFRRLDHAAIFVMIAGTYTPLTLTLMPTLRGRILLAFVWSGAIAGIIGKLFFPARFERYSVVAYLALGWAILGAVGPLIQALPLPGLLMLTAGGLFYSFGVIFHVRKRLPMQNALWHACVLAGAACQFAVIWRFVAAG